MTQNRLPIPGALIVCALTLGACAAASASPTSTPTDHHTAHHADTDRPDKGIEPVDQQAAAGLDDFWAEIDRTGLAPIGQNADGSGPYGWVHYDELLVVDGVPHDDVRVFDADGVHIGWIVYGLPPLTVAEYDADPEGHRLAGLARMAELEAAAAAANGGS